MDTIKSHIVRINRQHVVYAHVGVLAYIQIIMMAVLTLLAPAEQANLAGHQAFCHQASTWQALAALCGCNTAKVPACITLYLAL